MSRTNPERETEGVSDPSDYIQNHRSRSILDRRDIVIEQREKALELEIYGEINSDLASKMVRTAVEAYVFELEHKIKEHLPDEPTDRGELSMEEQAARYVWYEVDLGSVDREHVSYSFSGLREYINAPSQLVESFTVEKSDPVHGSRVVEESVGFEIPREISMNAYRALNYYANVLGLDVNTDDKLPRTSLVMEDV